MVVEASPFPVEEAFLALEVDFLAVVVLLA